MQDVQKLEEDYLRHRALYAAGTPEISDAEYDALEAELRAAAPDSPVLDQVDDIASDSKLPKIKHNTPMLSLQKCYTEEEFQTWVKTHPKKVNEESLVVMPKFDGCAIELRYTLIGSIFTLDKALTRGKGEYGEDVTANIKKVSNVPATILSDLYYPEKGGIRNVSVRGELIITKECFANLNKDGKFKSARNLATGTIKGDDSSLVKARGLEFIAYNTDIPFSALFTRLDYLEVCGFKTAPHKFVPVLSAPSFWSEKNANKKEFEYDIDGLVLAINNIHVQQEMGSTSHHPRAFVAWKFDSEVVQTVIKDIVWQVSRTGSINPVAILEPVYTEGATISRATLHNISEMKRLEIRILRTVDLVRQGGVIPKILKCYYSGKEPGTPTLGVLSGKGASFQYPLDCPECGEPTQILTSEGDVETLYCTNPSCPAVAFGKILHYIKTMDMKGFGPVLLTKIMTKGRVHIIADLYCLYEEDFTGIEGVGEKIAQRAVEAIASCSKNVKLGRFIFALGIPGVGKVMAENLAVHLKTPDKLTSLTQADLVGLPDAGEKTLAAIFKYLSNEVVQKLVLTIITGSKSLMAPYVTFEEVQSTEGKSVFVITGTLSIGRKEFAALIEQAGGVVADTVSKKVNFLVAGDDCGSKLDKAKKLGVKILSEAEAKKLLKLE